MAKPIVCIQGHPLAAPENRLPFAAMSSFETICIAPAKWKAKGSGVMYSTLEAPEQMLGTLETRFNGHNSLFLWRGILPGFSFPKPDLWFSWEEPWCLACLQISSRAKRIGARFLFYAAENRPKRLPWGFRVIERIVFARADGALAVSLESEVELRRRGFQGPIYRMPLWSGPFSLLPYDADTRELAFIGRLIPLKRVDLLIQALALLPGYRLRILGDGPERQNLESLAARLDLGDRVRFLGRVPHEQMARNLEGVSLVVLPTAADARRAEQFGRAVPDALQCGLPVLASDSGNLEQWTRESGMVHSIPMPAPGDLRKAVLRLHAAPPPEATRAQAAKDALDRYSPRAVGAHLERVFGSILEKES